MNRSLQKKTDSEQALVTAGVLCLRILVFCVLFMPLIVTPSTFFPFVVGKAIYSRILIELAVILWVPLMFLVKSLRPSKNSIIISLGIYILASILSSLFGVSFNASFWSTFERMQGLIDLAHWFLFTLILTSVFRTYKDWQLLLSVNIFASIIVCLIGILQYSGNHSLIPFPFVVNPSNGRVESTLGNATYVGAFSVVNIYVALALILANYKLPILRPLPDRTRKTRRNQRSSSNTRQYGYIWKLSTYLNLYRFLWVLGLILNFVVLVLSGTRGAIFGFSIALIFLTALYALAGNVQTLRKLALILLFGFIISITALLGFKNSTLVKEIGDLHPTASRIVNFTLKDPSMVSRLAAWDSGVTASLDKPLLGWGPENFIVAWGRYFDKSDEVNERFDQAHNKIIEELTTRGILGLIVYLAVWVLIARVLIRNLRTRHTEEQLFMLLISSALCAYFFQNLFLFDTLSTYSQFIILTCLVASINSSYWNKSPENEIVSIEESNRTLLTNGKFHIKTSTLAVTALSITFVLMIFSIYFFNAKPYAAAQSTVLIGMEGIQWNDKKNAFNDAIEDAPGLANYPRLLLIRTITEQWVMMSSEERKEAYQLVNEESVKALKQEPENWRLHYILARFYQISTTDDASRLIEADKHVIKLEELAPGTVEARIAREVNDKVHEVLK